MWKLLRADLTALANAIRVKEARGAMWSSLVAYVLMSLGGAVAGGRFVVSKPVLRAVDEHPEVVAPPLLALVLFVPMAFTVMMAFGEARKLLFGTASAEVALTAPVPRIAIVARVAARALFTSASLQIAITLPAVAGIAGGSSAGWALAWAFPAVAVAVSLPCVAALVLVLVVVQRFAAGPRLKAVLNVAGALIAIVIALFIGAGFVAGKDFSDELAAGLSGGGLLPSWLAAPGHAWAAAAGFVAPGSAIAALALWSVAALPSLWLAARLYPSAWERSLTLAGGHAVGRGTRRWPRGVAASVVRKDLAETFQARMNFAGFAFFGAVAVLFLGSDLFTTGKVRAGSAPPQLSLLLGLCTLWPILVMMLATLQGSGFFFDEMRRYDLLASSPASRRALLRGKLPAILLPHAWILLVLVVAAPFMRRTGFVTTLGFVAAAVPALLLSLGILIALGTLPAMNRDQTVEATSQVPRVLAVAVAVTAPNVFLMIRVHDLRSLLHHHYATPGREQSLVLVAAVGYGLLWIAGLAFLVLGLWIARRNVERLLGPRA